MKLSTIAAVVLTGSCLGACADDPAPIYYAPPPPPVHAAVRIYAPPPSLPIYEQPPLPGPGYIWTPGYWAWSAAAGDYYWVPGAWVLAPEPGLLWTPAWWGWSSGAYVFHGGYWGPHVGFYGGIAYGFGYTGAGYQGGYWNGGSFFYNRTVNHITTVNVTNVYNQTIVNRVNVNTAGTSFNGGPNGVAAAPTLEERAAASERRVAPTPVQSQAHAVAARSPQAFANANRGLPPAQVLASPPPQPPQHGELSGQQSASPVARAPSKSLLDEASSRQAGGPQPYRSGANFGDNSNTAAQARPSTPPARPPAYPPIYGPQGNRPPSAQGRQPGPRSPAHPRLQPAPRKPAPRHPRDERRQ